MDSRVLSVIAPMYTCGIPVINGTKLTCKRWQENLEVAYQALILLLLQLSAS